MYILHISLNATWNKMICDESPTFLLVENFQFPKSWSSLYNTQCLQTDGKL